MGKNAKAKAKGKGAKQDDGNPNRGNRNDNSRQKNSNSAKAKNSKNQRQQKDSSNYDRTCSHFQFINEERVRSTFSNRLFNKALSGAKLTKKEKDTMKSIHPCVNWYSPENISICLVCGQCVDDSMLSRHFTSNHCLALSLEDKNIFCTKCDTYYEIEPNTLCAKLLNIDKGVTPLTVASTSTEKSDVRLKGLYNLGNSCWMNSTLQILCHLPVFSQSNQPMCSSFSNLREQLLETEMADPKKKSKSYAIRPNQFVSVLNQKLDFLDVREQQDANEFLILFLDLIRNEEGGRSNCLQSNNLDEVKQCLSTPLDRLFGFIMKKEIKCSSCNQSKFLYERSASLSLFIPVAGSTTLDECLQMFFSDSSPDDRHECEFCSQMADCIMTPSLIEDCLPEVLVIHLSRFRYGKNGFVKNNIHIDFDEQLNLMPILNIDAKYHLLGFITHYGTIDMGHYTALAKVNHKYYLFDDDTVTAVDKESGFQLQPYIMFYIKDHANQAQAANNENDSH